MFEEDLKRCTSINEKWNKKQREIREKAISKQQENDIIAALEKVELEKKKIKEMKENIEEIVRKEKEQSKTFITAENIDAAIEQALANPVDYNFALISSGEKILGRDNIPGRDKNKASMNQ